MSKFTCGFLAVLFSGFVLAGCTKSEVVKSEEPVVPAVTAAPETTLPKPEPPPPPPPPQPVVQPAPQKAEVVPEKVAQPEPPKKTEPIETVRKTTLETIHFDFDKSDLRPADREILARNAALLTGNMKVKVKIEGHCDERGSAEYNLALGERRARSAQNYLVTLGVSADRLSIISYGKEMPIDPGHDEEAWAKNRRARFVNLGE